jgi:biotin carboxylase
VLPAAAVALALDVPCNSPAAAEAARDKYIMRTLMAQAGVPCPWFRRYTLDLRAGFQEARRQEAAAARLAEIAREVPYPCVLKPTTLNGSRGVMRADNPTEFVARGLRLAQLLQREFGAGEHPFLVEAFLPGVEVALEGILDAPRPPATNNANDGNSGGGAERAPELTVLALFDKPDPLDGPFFEETIYVTPSRLPADVQAAIARCAAAAAAAIGLRTGPIHAELRVNDRGPWMLEIAGRSIGGLCGRTLRFGLAGGMTLEELIVRQACGLPWREALSSATSVQDASVQDASVQDASVQDASVQDASVQDASVQPVGQASGVMMIPIPEAGQLRAVEGVAVAEAVPGIEGVEISVALHHTVTPLPEGESYLGFIFARGATPAAVEASLRAAHACLRFTIVPEIELGL